MPGGDFKNKIMYEQYSVMSDVQDNKMPLSSGYLMQQQ